MIHKDQQADDHQGQDKYENWIPAKFYDTKIFEEFQHETVLKKQLIRSIIAKFFG
jgi:hypothetical protein